MNSRPDAPQKRALIVEYKRKNPRATNRVIASEHGISETFVQRTLLDHQLNSPSTKPSRPQCLEPAPPKEKPDPLIEAERWLVLNYTMNLKPPRLTRRGDMQFLDGQPVQSFTQLMRAVNQERVFAGEPQLNANPEWVLK